MFACLGNIYLPWYWFIHIYTICPGVQCPKIWGIFFQVDEAMTCWLQAIQSLPPSAPKGLLGLIPGMNLGWRFLACLAQDFSITNDRSSRRFLSEFFPWFSSPPLAPDLCVQWTYINLAINQSDIICLNGFQCFLWNHSLTLVGISWVFLCHFSHQHQKKPKEGGGKGRGKGRSSHQWVAYSLAIQPGVGLFAIKTIQTCRWWLNCSGLNGLCEVAGVVSFWHTVGFILDYYVSCKDGLYYRVRCASMKFVVF